MPSLYIQRTSTPSLSLLSSILRHIMNYDPREDVAHVYAIGCLPVQLLAQTLHEQTSDAGDLELCILERQLEVLDHMALAVAVAKTMKLLAVNIR